MRIDLTGVDAEQDERVYIKKREKERSEHKQIDA